MSSFLQQEPRFDHSGLIEEARPRQLAPAVLGSRLDYGAPEALVVGRGRPITQGLQHELDVRFSDGCHVLRRDKCLHGKCSTNDKIYSFPWILPRKILVFLIMSLNSSGIT